MAEAPLSPAQSDAWDVVKDDWSSLDQSQAVMLVTKARRLGLMDQVMLAVCEEERLCAQLQHTPGSMNDSPKRLREATVITNLASDGRAGYGSLTYAPPPCSSYNVPPPLPKLSGSEGATLASDIALPEGVTSMADWACTVVSFGKYKGKKSYVEILTDESEDVVGYKKYLYDHFSHGSPQLRDLTAYLKACGYGVKKIQQPVIPGTTIIREFKR